MDPGRIFTELLSCIVFTFYTVLCFTQVPLKIKTWHNLKNTPKYLTWRWEKQKHWILTFIFGYVRAVTSHASIDVYDCLYISLSNRHTLPKDTKDWTDLDYTLNVKSRTEFRFSVCIGKCKLMSWINVRAQRLRSSKQKYNQLKTVSNTSTVT